MERSENMHRELRAMAGALTVVAVVLAAGFLAGCGAPEEPAATGPQGEPSAAAAEGQAQAAPAPTAGPLAGTDWRLVEIQSMDDAQGTTKPDDPSLYTMRLNDDGTANMRLNCNRANGTWSAEPGADESSGRFTFGPLAMTRALCPPPSLDERIAKDAEYVRSYLLRDGRLYLSLMADGGIYTWEPNPDGAGGGTHD